MDLEEPELRDGLSPLTIRSFKGLFATASLLVGATLLRLYYVQHTLIVNDELEHLHGAYLVAQGRTPYLDFFEHHTPLFYFAFGSLLRLLQPSFTAIIDVRMISAVTSILTIMAFAYWAERLYGWRQAVIVLILLLANFFLFASGCLAYLDTFALAFIVGSAIVATYNPSSPLAQCVAAFLMGVAILITQKAVAALPASFAILFIATHRDGRVAFRLLWKLCAAYLCGALASFVLLLCLLGARGMPAFITDNIVLNLHWPARHRPFEEIKWLAATDGVVYCLAALGCLWQWRRVFTRRNLIVADSPLLFLSFLVIGALLIPSVWEEYFVLVVPFAVVVATQTLDELITLRRLTAPLIICAIALTLMDIAVRVSMGQTRFSLSATAAVFTAWALGGLIVNAFPRLRRSALVGLVAAFPVIEQVDYLDHNTNAGQRERIEYILTHSSPNEALFDGYSGYGVFRPHAYRYWFLHEEVRALFPLSTLVRETIEALRSVEPKFVVLDEHSRSLGVEFQKYIDANYASTPFDDLKQRRS